MLQVFLYTYVIKFIYLNNQVIYIKVLVNTKYLNVLSI